MTSEFSRLAVQDPRLLDLAIVAFNLAEKKYKSEVEREKVYAHTLRPAAERVFSSSPLRRDPYNLITISGEMYDILHGQVQR